MAVALEKGQKVSDLVEVFASSFRKKAIRKTTANCFATTVIAPKGATEFARTGCLWIENWLILPIDSLSFG
jgi:hypothetical protein